MELNAVFYKAQTEYNTYEKHVNAPYLRTEINAKRGCRYGLTVSGLGFYELFINGAKITKGLLAPYISSPDDIVYFDEYDITPYLKSGKDNCIGLILGNGMQNAPGGRVWDFDIARFRNAPCFATLLKCMDSKGEETEEDIGAVFRWAPSPVIFDDLRSGCFYDANLETPGWNEAGFNDKKWQAVTKADKPRGEYRICESDPVKVFEEIKAKEIKKARIDPAFDNRGNMRLDTQFKFNKLGKQGVMFDFGINSAGICRLKIDGEKGQKIYIQFCELMTSGGRPSYKNTGSFYPDGYGQSMLYICKGKKNEVFEPMFCYYGFRCAVVFGLKDYQIKDDTLTYLRAGSDLKYRGGFECSDSIMNALGDMVRNSDRSNFYYFPTDCPHREKNGWTGDAAVSAEHMLLTLTPEKSYREWLRNICKAQRDDGMLPGIIPTGGWGYEWGNGPAWDNVLSELCWQIYRLRGDLTPAKECGESLLRYLSFITSIRNEKGLVDFGLGDWLQPGRGAGDPVAPVYLTSTVMSMYIASKTADLFREAGKELQAEFALKLRDSLRHSIIDNLIDYGTMTVLPRCQSAQALCLYYDVFEPCEKQAAAKVLEEIIHEDGDKINCGMLGLRVIFHVLSDYGNSDLAYKMITRTDFPSYGMFVKRGMTSLAEDFLPDDELDDSNSLNHHFFGDISSWFIQKIAGLCVNPKNTSPDCFEIRPAFIDALDYAKADYEAPCGKVNVSWERKGDKIILAVKAPAKATGDIKLPAGYVFSADQPLDGRNFTCLKSGKYTCIKK